MGKYIGLEERGLPSDMYDDSPDERYIIIEPEDFDRGVCGACGLYYVCTEHVRDMAQAAGRCAERVEMVPTISRSGVRS